MTSGTTGTELVYRHQIRPVVQTASMWFSVIVPRWQGRKASLAAQLDLLNFQTPSGPKEEVRVVVTNHGPALMQKIEVQLFDNDGESLTIAETDITALWPKMPVEAPAGRPIAVPDPQRQSWNPHSNRSLDPVAGQQDR
jgi:hypothetical protein